MALSTSHDGYPECFLSEQAGFLPAHPPAATLPAGFEAWDRLATELPARVAALTVGDGLDHLPALDASALPESVLSRAASLLGLFVHAGVRERQLLREDASTPAHLIASWETVCHRLRRPGAGLTYTDLILCNWRLRDPAGARVAENMDLLTPVYGSEEERLFYLVMVETHAVATPLVGSVRRLADAMGRADDDAVIDECRLLSDVLDTMTFRTFLKVDPNPSSPFFVDHLVWAKTVAPFAYPVREGELGLSGGGSPVFHVFDALLGRSRWDTSIGHELVALRRWMNPPLSAFIEGAARMDLPGYVAARPRVGAAFQHLREAYGGERGWLGMHRLKVYGFMEVAFKAGRTQTNGGFAGAVADRAWEALDRELESARQERGPRGQCPFARQSTIRQAAQAPIFQVTLDAPVDVRPGDRLGIWPRNPTALVERTLAALQATGDEPLALTAEWTRTFEERAARPAGTATVPLRTFLSHATLRPLPRDVGKALLRLAHAPALHAVLEQRREDHHEVWEAIDLLRQENYDTRRLWRAAPWHGESLARLLPPAQRRIYSVSSGPGEPLALTVGRLAVTSPRLGADDQIAREGTGSSHLTQAGTAFPVEVVRPSRFALPADDRPVLMFAAGSGISPFRAFWQARRGCTSRTWLFVSVRDPGSLAYADELATEVTTHGLELHVCCSRCDCELISAGGRVVTRDVPRGYIGRAIAHQAQPLWRLLRPREEGGDGAHVYICGQTGFAHAVIEALKAVVGTATGSPVRGADVAGFFRRLRAEGRLQEDIFTTFAPADAPSVLPYEVHDTSDVLARNDDLHGYWSIIRGQVYDLTEFRWLHPGGARLIRMNAGIDATRSYEQVNHHLNAEVHASLNLYKIGRVRRLDFGSRWGVTIRPGVSGDRPATATARADGLQYVTLHDLYRHWIRYVFHVVEIENSLANNRDLGRSARLVSAAPGSPLHHAFQFDILRVFCETSLNQIVGDELRHLWHLHVGLCSPSTPLPSLGEHLDAAAARWRPLFEAMLRDCRDRIAGRGPAGGDTCEARLETAQAWLADLKRALADGIRLFERHESGVVESAGQELSAVLAAVPDRVLALAQALSRFRT